MWNWFCVFVRCKINHGKFWGTLVQKQTSHKFALILGRIGNWLCVFVRRKCKSKVVCVDKRKNQGKFGSKLIFCVFSKTRKFPRICSSGYFKDLEIKYVPKPTNIYYLPNLPSLRAGLRSRKESEAFGWSWNRIPKYTRSRSRIFQPTPTPEVQLIQFLHRIPKLGILPRGCWNGTNSFQTFIVSEKTCCAARFPLIASCYKIVDRQTLFTFCRGVGSRCRKFLNGWNILDARSRSCSRSRSFSPRLRNLFKRDTGSYWQPIIGMIPSV